MLNWVRDNNLCRFKCYVRAWKAHQDLYFMTSWYYIKPNCSGGKNLWHPAEVLEGALRHMARPPCFSFLLLSRKICFPRATAGSGKLSFGHMAVARVSQSMCLVYVAPLALPWMTAGRRLSCPGQQVPQRCFCCSGLVAEVISAACEDGSCSACWSRGRGTAL